MARKPNIILINCDDLGYGDLGCYGSEFNNTPAIDRLATEGTRLTDFYMASAVCTPSRAAMLTGCYAQRVGMHRVLFPGEAVGLDPAEETLASMLKANGYATSIVGKWHLGDQPAFLPTRHGFDEYYGLPYSNDMGRQPRRIPRLKKDPDSIWPPLPLLDGEEVIQEQPDQAGLTERYVERAVRFMRKNKDRPFFLYFAHMHVHLPIIVADRFLRKARNGPYGAAVEAIDWSVEVILHELQQLRLDDDTLIIFTSDNGSKAERGGSNHPLRGTKGSVWEGGFRLPCLWRWPGKIPAGVSSSEIVASMDFLPTLATLTGTTPQQERPIDGLDVSAHLLGQAQTSPRDHFVYYIGQHVAAVRQGQYKLHLRRDHREMTELYDLTQPDAEFSPPLPNEEHTETIAQLTTLAQSTMQDLGDEWSNIPGPGRREPGKVENPAPLTTYNPNSPYIWAEYDLPDAG